MLTQDESTLMLFHLGMAYLFSPIYVTCFLILYFPN